MERLHFPPPHFSKSKGPLRRSVQCHHWLPNLLTPSPALRCSSGTALSSLTCLSLSKVGPLPNKTSPNSYPHPVSQPRSFVGPQFWWQWQQVSFHKQTRAHLVKTHHILVRDKHCPQQARKFLHTTDLKDKAARTQQQSTHNTHWRHCLECQALGNRGHYMAGH